MPGCAVVAQPGFGERRGSREAAGENRRFVFLLWRAAVVPVRAVVTPQQVVGLGRVGAVGGFHQRLPGWAGFRAELVEEDLPCAFMQEGTVQRGIRRAGGEFAVERHQPAEGLARFCPLQLWQRVDGLV
ncbi:hypothetical protein D9M68_861920 [compost metagenome]